MTCPPCNNRCNHGTDCPARRYLPKCPCGRPDCFGCGAMSKLEYREPQNRKRIWAVALCAAAWVTVLALFYLRMNT